MVESLPRIEYKKLRYQYLLNKFPFSMEEAETKYWDDFTKRAHFVSNDTYRWRTVEASDLYELWLVGVLKEEGVSYEHD